MEGLQIQLPEKTEVVEPTTFYPIISGAIRVTVTISPNI